MNWLAPLEIGLTMGLLLAGAVLALALAWRLLAFPDLTVEAAVPMGAAAYSVGITHGASVATSLLFAVAAAALCGTLTAVLHVRFAVNKFLAGIIVVAIAYSLSLRLMAGSNIGILKYPTLFSLVAPLDEWAHGRFHLGTVGILLIVCLVTTVASIWILSTWWGIRFRAVGANPQFASSLAISVPRYTIAGLTVTNGLAGSSGALLAMHQGFADVGMGQGVLIFALAAITIGERLVPRRLVSPYAHVVIAAVVGSVVYQSLVACAVRAGLAPTDLRLATALLVLVVVAFRLDRDAEPSEPR